MTGKATDGAKAEDAPDTGKKSFQDIVELSENVLREIRRPFRLRERWYFESHIETFTQGEVDGLNLIMSAWSEAWSVNKEFRTTDEAHRFIGGAKAALDCMEQMLAWLVDHYKTYKVKALVSGAHTPKEKAFFWLSILLAPVAGAVTFYNTASQAKPPPEWLLVFFVVTHAAIPWIVVSLVRGFIAERYYKKNSVPLSSELLRLTQQLGALRERYLLGEKEIFDELDHHKTLRRDRDRLELEDSFREKISMRALAERMALIEAETRAAMTTAKTLEEQHTNTEAIRLKYARELVELQREVKAEANQDLTDKLAMVQSLLGDTP